MKRNETLYIFNDPDYEKLHKHFKKLKVVSETAKLLKQPLVFFVYYSGHGSSYKGECWACLTEKDEFFPLERRLKKLKLYQNVHTYAVFDCCREINTGITETIEKLWLEFEEKEQTKSAKKPLPGTCSVIFMCDDGKKTSAANTGVGKKTQWLIDYM